MRFYARWWYYGEILIIPFEKNRIEKSNNVFEEPMLFSEQTIIYKNLKIIPDQRYIFQDGKEINLSRLEFDTLLYLLHNINRVLSKEQIYEAVWKHETDDYINAVTCVIYKLRQKIDVRGKVILQPHGKEFFTWYSKHLFT